jgi:regulator of sirC expression with transglutaminase-like and TPR domain
VSHQAPPRDGITVTGPTIDLNRFTTGRANPVARVRSRGVALLAAQALLLAGCRASYTPTVVFQPLPRARGLAAEAVPEILALPEEEIDVGRAALVVAQEDRPALEIGPYLRRLDEIALRLRRRTPEGASVREALAELVRLVQPGGRFASGLTESPATAEGLPPELDLARILDGERGNCMGYGLLYLAVAERAGWPVYGVHAPEHFFVRFDDGVTRVNLEPTRGGATLSDESYVARRRVHAEARERGVYLRSESKRQVIASLLANRAGLRALAGRLDEARADAERALAVKPYWPQGHVNLGLVNEFEGRCEQAEAEYKGALRYDPHCVGALNNLAALYVRSARRIGAPPGASAPGSYLPRAGGPGMESGAPPRPATDGKGGSVPNGGRLGRLLAAEQMIGEALRLAHDRPHFHETAAAVATARGDLRAAVGHLRRAVKLEPGNEQYAKELRSLEARIAGEGSN